MKKKNILGVVFIPVGAILLNACGSVDSVNNELALDEVSDSWIVVNGVISEYGHCDDGWDNDGDGLVDTFDPDCHINPGPLRDASLYDFPIGHNFFPDIALDIPGGPGWAGGFRDRPQMTRWFRFLTDLYGDVAAIDLIDPAVDPTLVPIPAPLELPIPQGTFAQGNNNNPDLFELHIFYLEHGFLPGLDVAPLIVPASVDPYIATGTEYIPTWLNTGIGGPGIGGPGIGGLGIGNNGGLEGASYGNQGQNNQNRGMSGHRDTKNDSLGLGNENNNLEHMKRLHKAKKEKETR